MGVAMPVSGLVVTLTSQSPQREAAIEEIRADLRIEIGAIGPSKMAIVVDTATSSDDKRLWEWIQAIEGVLQVEVALIGFE
jgi:nitrate reductase NapAB chaperone NapD